MLDSKSLVAELDRLRKTGVTTNAELGKLLSLPSSRVSEIFTGKRTIKIDEMKVLVEHFGLEGARAEPFSAESLEPLLDALLPLVPPSGRMTDQSRRALAAALAYGIDLLGDRASNPASEDALAVAARGAVARFREITGP